MATAVLETNETSGEPQLARPAGWLSRRRRRHKEMLCVASVAVVLALLLEVLPNQRVAFRGWLEYPLPHLCASRSVFNAECPGCGLTRSFIYFFRGDLQTSLGLHRLGWLLALATVGQLPYRAYLLANPRREPRSLVAQKTFGYTLIALLIGNWLCKVVLASIAS